MRRFFFFLFVISIATTFSLRGLTRPAEVPDPSPIMDLEIPWSCDEEYRVSQGNDGRTHHGWGQYAWDFAIPLGTTVTAPAAGVVRKVRDDSTRYGCDAAYGWDANYVVIDVGDGHDVLLLHLEAGSALVEKGDYVVPGQPVAKVGNSGWVCGPHLHMQVQKSCTSWWCPSVPGRFKGGLNPETGIHLRPDTCFEPEAI